MTTGGTMTVDHGLVAAPPRDFLSPRDVRVGDGAVAEIGPLLERWAPGGGPVVVVCDRALTGLGLVGRVVGALEEAGHEVTVFDEVTGEPDSETAEAVVRVVRDRDPDAVVGMGGGSAMDLAKVGAALATNPGGVLDYVGAGKVSADPRPLVLVPTTAGTGAEATRIAMISHGGGKQIINDPRLVPVAAVLDPELVASLPRPVTAATGLDALTHAVESFLSTHASALSTRMAREAMGTLARALPRAYADGDDMEARRGTLYGAHLAGLGLNAGVVLGHSIAYTIANRVHLPHGITAAMALPYCVAYNAEGAADRLDVVARELAGPDADRGDVYQWIDDLNRVMQVPPSLEAAGISAGEPAGMAAECRERYPRPNNPVDLTGERLEELYGYLWEGDLAGCVDAFHA